MFLPFRGSSLVPGMRNHLMKKKKKNSATGKQILRLQNLYLPELLGGKIHKSLTPAQGWSRRHPLLLPICSK